MDKLFSLTSHTLWQQPALFRATQNKTERAKKIAKKNKVINYVVLQLGRLENARKPPIHDQGIFCLLPPDTAAGSCPPVLLCFPVTDLVRKIAHHDKVAHTAAGSNRQTRSRDVRTAVQQQDRASAGLAPHPCPPVLLCFPVTDLVRKIAHHDKVAHTAAGSNRQTRSRDVRTATSRGTV